MALETLGFKMCASQEISEIIELLFLQHSDRLFLGVWDLDEALFSVCFSHKYRGYIIVQSRERESQRLRNTMLIVHEGLYCLL